MAYISELNLDRNLLDADGFVPTSQKLIIGNYVQDKDNLPLLIDRVGTGSQVYSAGVVNMSVTAGQYAVAQTKFCHPYVSSHPSLYTITFAKFQTQANVVKKVGAYRSSTAAPYTANIDGVYLESDGTTYNIVISKNGVLTTIPRASWDDPLDGTGASGINYDWSKFTVLQIDFLYLGGTWVRFALIVGGELVYFHTYRHSGTAASTFVNSPYFFIRWDIHSSTGVGEFDQICGAFSVLGGKDTIGKEFAFDDDVNFINANAVGTEYLLCAVRLKSTNLNAYSFPSAANALSITNDNYILRLRLNPTIAGAALVWNNLVNTSCEFARGDVAGTNTITATNPPLASVYAAQQQSSSLRQAFLAALGSKLDGTADILTLSAVPLGSNMDIYGALNMIEI
jgi:hypothetical protein